MAILLRRPTMIALELTLLACVFPGRLSIAQAPQPQGSRHTASCAIDKSNPTEADIAFFQGDFKKAETLYSAAVAKNPSDRYSRELEIDSLLAEGKSDDARKKTSAWTSSAPTDAYAILTASELRHAEGDWLEGYALALKALKVDPCLPAAYQGLGDYESLAGFHATAHKHFTLAHELAPNDPSLAMSWIESLDHDRQIVELKNLLQSNIVINDKRRKSLQKQLDNLEARTENRCELASISGPARIPMVPIYRPGWVGIQAYGLEIAFNGKKRILQIDTGATGFLFTHSAGATLGLPVIEKSQVGGFGGTNDASIQRADSVRIGGLEFKNCAVDTLAIAGVLGGGKEIGEKLDDIDGIVGADIFDRYLITLDYIKHEIRLAPLPQPPDSVVPASQLDPLGGRTGSDWMNVDRYIAPSMKSWTQIYRNGHALMMPTRILSKGKSSPTLLFMVDTGSANNLIDIATARQFTRIEDTMYGMRGVGPGAVRLSETGKFAVDFAGLRLPVDGMNAIDLSRSDGVKGFLGYPTLDQLVIHIDYRDDLIKFDAPNGKHE